MDGSGLWEMGRKVHTNLVCRTGWDRLVLQGGRLGGLWEGARSCSIGDWGESVA